MAESKRPMFVALFITGCAIVILFKVHKFDVQRDVPWHLLKKTTAHEMSVQRQSPKRVVLVYTRFWGWNNWVRNESGCCSEHFELTYKKERFNESDIVVFHAKNMPSSDVLQSLLKSRPNSQRWVYAMWESPMLTPNPKRLNGLFNLTWHYRTDSDIWGRYGSYEQLSREDVLKMNKTATVTDYTKGKSELVAWMVSNCGPQLRISFVRELKKHIKVDVFGRCSGKNFGDPRSCSKNRNKDCLLKYKFYLSFENALCEDYVTEKYWGNLGKKVNLFLSLVLSIFPFVELLWKKCTKLPPYLKPRITGISCYLELRQVSF